MVRTPPAWADAGQRISLALWDGAHTGPARHHPHPHPDRRFRLDLHRHLWDAHRADELRVRSGADKRPDAGDSVMPALELPGTVPQGYHCAVDRWAAEARILLRSEGRPAGAVAVRHGARRRLILDLAADGNDATPPELRVTAADKAGDASALPVLPDAATWVLPDLELIRTGAIEAGRLHPLVASALVPGHSQAGPPCSGSCSNGGSAPCACRPGSGSWPPPIRGPRPPTAGS